MRALQLMAQAIDLQDGAQKKFLASDFYAQLAPILSRRNNRYESWRLQYLTDLSKLPDEYVQKEITYKPLRPELKKAIKEGIGFEGIELVEKKSLSVR